MREETRKRTMEHHDLLSGLVRLHVLHHAAEHEIYGQWMIEELAGHGYRLSPGTLYPMLHKMERDGYLVSRDERDGRTVRKLYAITGKGKEGLALAKERVREFTGEAMER
ncbi:PadR family transcriptional regulator [Brucella tritici]|uniref:PadR family transcriptional regulator n=1 Tax=Brucella tritici TaxID=94626 RepID=UPI003CE4DE14